MTAKRATETWMTSKQPVVYMMASRERSTLYIGVTGNLKLRVWEHRDAVVERFTKRYGVKRLVWFEFHPRFSIGHQAREAVEEMESCLETRVD
jgi:predicted GIY-YIG superfamily endonuclease